MSLGTGVRLARQVSKYCFEYLSTICIQVCCTHDSIPKNQIDVATPKNSTIMIVNRRTWILLLLHWTSCELSRVVWMDVWRKRRASVIKCGTESLTKTILKIPMLYESKKRTHWLTAERLALTVGYVMCVCVLFTFVIFVSFPLFFNSSYVAVATLTASICFSMKMKLNRKQNEYR